MAFMSMMLVWLFLCLIIYVPGYLLTGISLYAIGKRRGIEQPWRAWVPLVNFWLIGCISDQYQAIVRGKVKYKRLTLLGLILAIPLLIALDTLLVSQNVGSETLGLLLFLSFLCVVAALVVITYMALYDLYMSCDPKHAVLYLVLSIVLSVLQPVCLFLCRKKDLGFPL